MSYCRAAVIIFVHNIIPYNENNLLLLICYNNHRLRRINYVVFSWKDTDFPHQLLEETVFYGIKRL